MSIDPVAAFWCIVLLIPGVIATLASVQLLEQIRHEVNAAVPKDRQFSAFFHYPGLAFDIISAHRVLYRASTRRRKLCITAIVQALSFVATAIAMSVTRIVR